jgi:hypothetical protein
MPAADGIVYLADLAGVPQRGLVRSVSWTLEERDDSTNRLTVEVPLGDASDVTADRELLLAGRRFVITSVLKNKAARIATLAADEVQVELASDPLATYGLAGDLLSTALTKALAGSRWEPGEIDDNTGTYYADFENITALDAVRFLVQQSRLRAVFDSSTRIVHLRDMSAVDADRVFTYGAGVDGIDRTEEAPTFTVIYPTGRDGLTIEGVNQGLPYVEDFGWYTAQGVPIDVARERFRRVEYWTDERYIYNENLRRAALARLAVSAYPAITYSVSVDSAKAVGLVLGHPVWVVDHELGLKLTAQVAAVTRTQDASEVQVELGFLPPSQSTITSGLDVGDSTPSESGEALFQTKNQTAVTLGPVAVPVLQVEVNVYADTGFQVGVVAVVEITAPGLLSGYFLLNGSRLDVAPRQTAATGWVTLGLPFLITPVVAGATALDFYLQVDSGAGIVHPLGAEIYITARGAYGGITHERPDRTVRDEIRHWLDLAAPGDVVSVDVGLPITVGPSDAIDLAAVLAVTDGLVTWRPMPLWSITSGDVLTMWGGAAAAEYTIQADTGVTAALVLDQSGGGTWDLSVVLGLNPGTHDCLIVETGVEFDVEVSE